ncbi:hypothetical protein BCR41DRAFT_344142 [Lobosporangium transversale]|uniref:Uncharacterized protein n=1 Tax=Lobosporangium transversale TaxID=64571 RepID=A0A1Y2H2R2_9FUNG|nr:hypothetical protein BCR41DRAFT_344142 [Lobosporangium transversale]ORZ28825.1 hypothetical protein BCR41DRAFT_344142 [Lobosporangium transversale]|eukprot:XP_021886498.1 hypothetical protein BCR41DRAFT_344142 [Lobosporangium transversale]
MCWDSLTQLAIAMAIVIAIPIAIAMQCNASSSEIIDNMVNGMFIKKKKKRKSVPAVTAVKGLFFFCARFCKLQSEVWPHGPIPLFWLVVHGAINRALRKGQLSIDII